MARMQYRVYQPHDGRIFVIPVDQFGNMGKFSQEMVGYYGKSFIFSCKTRINLNKILKNAFGFKYDHSIKDGIQEWIPA